MPTTKAAAKAWRQSTKAQSRNKAVKDAIKKLLVQFRKAVTAGDKAKATDVVKQLVKAYDKAAQKKILSRNLVSRKKSRLAAALKKATR